MQLANPFLAMLAMVSVIAPVLTKDVGIYSQCKDMENCDKQGELRCEQFENGRWISHCDKGCRKFLAWSEDCDARKLDLNL